MPVHPSQTPTSASPCRNICVLDAAGAICTGCGRSTAEITGWLNLSPAERIAVNAAAAARLAPAQVPALTAGS